MSAAPIAVRRKTLTPEEVENLLSTIKPVRDRAIFTLMYRRGLRPSEIRNLELAHWDQRNGTLYTIRNQRRLPLEQYLSSAENAALRLWVRRRGPAAGPLFLSRERRPLGRNMMWLLFKRYAELAGLPPELCRCEVLNLSHHEHCSAVGLGSGPVATIARAESHTSCVYFIETTDRKFIKIGFSSRLVSRFRHLEDTMHPTPLRLLGYLPGTHTTERWLHEKFAAYRERGEWFRDCPPIRDFIRAVGLISQ